MRVISRKALRDFCESRKDGEERRKAERAMDHWYRVALEAECANGGELRRTFGSVDAVGDCVVFDVKGNDYRIIGRVRYDRQILHVLEVLTHAECDRQPWAERCGCQKPPPGR